MVSVGTPFYLPTPSAPHERERRLEKQQWMIRVQPGERA
jgi:hypothetical protein